MSVKPEICLALTSGVCTILEAIPDPSGSFPSQSITVYSYAGQDASRTQAEAIADALGWRIVGDVWVIPPSAIGPPTSATCEGCQKDYVQSYVVHDRAILCTGCFKVHASLHHSNGEPDHDA